MNLHQSLAEVLDAYALLIDTACYVLEHTSPLPAYISTTTTPAPLATLMPAALASAITNCCVRMQENERNTLEEYIHFIDQTDIVQVRMVLKRSVNGTDKFVVNIQEIHRSPDHPFATTPPTSEQLERHKIEIAELQKSIAKKNEIVDIILRQFEWSNESMNQINLRFDRLTQALEAKNEELKEHQHFVDRIVDISPGILYVYSLAEQRNVYASASVGKILGYSSTEIEQMGQHILPSLILPEDLPQVSKHHQQLVMNNSDEHQLIEYRMRSKSGRIRWYASYDKIFERNSDGHPTKIIGIAQDISQQKKINLELTRANGELKTFAYAASHDLKEPLNTISTIIELLHVEMNVDNEETQQLLDLLSSSTIRMRNLISDLLDYALLGKEDMQYAVVNLNDIVAEVLDDLNATIQRRSAQVSFAPLPILHANSAQLRRLLQNLISNALKYAKAQVVPTVHLSVSEEENAWVFSIQDNGIGIAEEHQNKIFQVFQKLHNRDEYEGTGIGLATCQRIIQNHKGDIWVESILGKGATFYFSLPKHFS
ncbi:MAG: ATP-binding protein [Bacteroidota bacterium]